MKLISALLIILLITIVPLFPASAQDIFEAVEKGDIERVKSLLESDPGLLNTLNSEGSSPLLSASWGENRDIIILLLERGADVNIKNSNGVTPLHGMSYRGHVECVRLAVAKGADVNAVDNYKQTPLHQAARSGSREIVDILIQNGADFNAKDGRGTTPLVNAASEGKGEIVELLISMGSDVNIETGDGWSPLIVASIGGHPETVSILLKNGAEADKRANNDYGGTSLYWAASRGHKEIVKELLAKGVSVNEKTNWGEPPLLSSISRGYKEIIEMLVSNSADVNLENNEGVFPLQKAITLGDIETAKLLIGNEANIKVVEKHNGLSMLHLAVYKGYKDITEFLIGSGAEIETKDNNGYSPLYYAKRFGHSSIAKLLEEHGAAPVTIKGNYGYSPLLNRDLNQNEAYIWYLGGCGWALKTNNNLLIFDYWEPGRSPAEPLLANGYINPDEIKGLNTYVFVTHDHLDHYDEIIYEWEKIAGKINYIFGWQAGENPDFIYMKGREKKTIGNLEVTTIKANHGPQGGTGFIVKADGLTVYHSGDHGNMGEEPQPEFSGELDYILDQGITIDIAFVSANWGMSLSAIPWTVERLLPKVTFPQHGMDAEFRYKLAAEEIIKRNIDTQVICAKFRGDRFFYKDGVIK